MEINSTSGNEKSAQRDVNTARALAVVRFGHRSPARPPVANTQTHRQDRLQYSAPLASAQCNDKVQLLNVKHRIKIVSFKKFSKVGDVRFRANVFRYHCDIGNGKC